MAAQNNTSPNTDDPTNTNDNYNDNGHSPWGWLILASLILIVVGFLAWFIYSRLRARRLGTQPASLNSFSDRNRTSNRNYAARGGIVGWVQTKFRGLNNRRTAGGAYESSARVAGRGGRRGFGPLDPDEAWNTTVGNEADYYEEQELGLHESATAADGVYGGSEYGMPARRYGASGGLEEVHPDNGRGRSRTRSELDDRYDEEMGATPVQPHDPFGDEAAAEPSRLRGISPRPHDETSPKKGEHQAKASADESPTGRRSIFREDM